MIENTEQQLEKFLGYLKSDPSNTQLTIDTAQLYIRLGRFNDALELVEKGKERSPGNPGLEFTHATIAMSSNQPDQAVDILRALLDRGVDNGGVRYNLSYSLALLGKMEEAQAVLEPVIDQLAPTTPEAYILLARIKHYLGELDKGEELARHFIQSCPGHPKINEAEGVMALLSLDNEDLETARRYADRCLAADQNNTESLVTMGSIALDDFETDKAAELFHRVLERRPKSGRAWLGIGLTEMLKGNLDKGEEALRACVEHMPTHLGSWNALAWCQITAGKIDEAEATLQKAMDIDRNFGETHGSLAVVALVRNKHDEAEQHIKRALRLNKNTFSAKYAQSVLSASMGDQEKAKSMLDQVMKTPVIEGGFTLEQSIQRFATKNQPTGNKYPRH